MGLERNPLKYQSDVLLGEKRPGSPVAHIPPGDRDAVGHGQELLGEKLSDPTGRVLRPGNAEKGRVALRLHVARLEALYMSLIKALVDWRHPNWPLVP